MARRHVAFAVHEAMQVRVSNRTRLQDRDEPVVGSGDVFTVARGNFARRDRGEFPWPRIKNISQSRDGFPGIPR
ncbi:hypothetical protein [Burkholderia latens]|uniref:hypothetical protein n=1 Tax=Burkholderia latens TaxID=488446 RepID=UPI00158A0B9D|nr:hypothetical protein [Burkholderia latens]